MIRGVSIKIGIYYFDDIYRIPSVVHIEHLHRRKETKDMGRVKCGMVVKPFFNELECDQVLGMSEYGSGFENYPADIQKKYREVPEYDYYIHHTKNFSMVLGYKESVTKYVQIKNQWGIGMGEKIPVYEITVMLKFAPICINGLRSVFRTTLEYERGYDLFQVKRALAPMLLSHGINYWPNRWDNKSYYFKQEETIPLTEADITPPPKLLTGTWSLEP